MSGACLAMIGAGLRNSFLAGVTLVVTSNFKCIAADSTFAPLLVPVLGPEPHDCGTTEKRGGANVQASEERGARGSEEERARGIASNKSEFRR